MTKRTCFVLILLFFLLPMNCLLSTQETEEMGKNADNFHFELSEPFFTDGFFQTKSGGVVWGPGFRLQAQNIRYGTITEDGQRETVIEAFGDLLLFYEQRIITGKHLSYRINRHEGYVEDAIIGLGPCYVGSDHVFLRRKGNIHAKNAWISTTPDGKHSWNLHAQEVKLIGNDLISAKNLSFKLLRLPLLYIPSYESKIGHVFANQVDYRFSWRSRKRKRLMARWQFYGNEHNSAWLHGSYFIGRGLGLGLDWQHENIEHQRTWRMRNLVAKDYTQADPDRLQRWRFKGSYEQKTSYSSDFQVHYDKLSDSRVNNDFSYDSFDNKHAGETFSQWSRYTTQSILTISAREKINPFQTVRKELPSIYYSPLYWSFPYTASRYTTPLVISARTNLAWFKYDYNSSSLNQSYESGRAIGELLASMGSMAGPIRLGAQAGLIAQTQNKSPRNTHENWSQRTLELKGEYLLKDSKSPNFLSFFSHWKLRSHVQSSPDEHYIFDLRDSLVRENFLRSGLEFNQFAQQDIFFRHRLYGDYFFDRLSGRSRFAYLNLESFCEPDGFSRYLLHIQTPRSANRLHRLLMRYERTVSTKLAFYGEYRKRDATAWRQNNPNPHILGRIRTMDQLLDSSLSDQRQITLTGFNYRVNPNWVTRIDFINGWDRKNENPYRVYSWGFGRHLGSQWQLQFQIMRAPDGWRYNLRLNIGNGPINTPAPHI